MRNFKTDLYKKIQIEGLFEMKFKPFDKNTSHHWATLMSWFQVKLNRFLSVYFLFELEVIHQPAIFSHPHRIFLDQREVLFLEAESGKIIEETFDSLIKSELAVHSLKQLKSKNLREMI